MGCSSFRCLPFDLLVGTHDGLDAGKCLIIIRLCICYRDRADCGPGPCDLGDPLIRRYRLNFRVVMTSALGLLIWDAWSGRFQARLGPIPAWFSGTYIC